MDEEIWKDVVGWEDYYQVSNLGRVKSKKRMVDNGFRVRTKKETILKKIINKGGYVKVKLHVNSISKLLSVHRLIAFAFIQNPENKPDINHKNGIRDDNRLENLEWCTKQENQIHSFKFNGRVCANKGILNDRNSKPVNQIDKRSGEIIKSYPSCAEASRQLNLPECGLKVISNAARNKKTNIAYGYNWNYQNN